MKSSLFTKVNKNTISAKQKISKLSPPKRVVFLIAIIGMILGTTGMVNSLFTKYSTTIPAKGGTITEGIVGTPRFINPVLAESNVDLDITKVVFSGLMKRDTNGELVPDLASGYSVSENQRVYLFTLRDDLQFHDGREITADDVVYTINQTQVSGNQSPHRTSWQGVKVESLDKLTIQFDLPQPFAGFLTQTTIGILPSHVWQDIPVEQFSFTDLNIEPIGSGPFILSKVNRSKSGLANSFKLKANRNFWSDQSFIKTLIFKLYPNKSDLVKAFERKEIDTMAGINPSLLDQINYSDLISSPLPRIFGLHFNTVRTPILKDDRLISIIEQALDKEKIVAEVLNSFGTTLSSPLPLDITTIENTTELAADKTTLDLQLELDKIGWVRLDSDSTGIRQKEGQVLQFSIATSDTPELVSTANIIKQSLAELGILVTINVFEIQNLELEIIQPRNFETLLFGQVIRHDTDLYAFWHSSQSNNEGLNITNYENSSVDKALTDALSTQDPSLRRNLYRTVEEQIILDKPAIFLYVPHLVYLTNRPIGNFNIKNVTHPSDRLNTITKWHLATERVWNFFNNSTNSNN